MAASRKDFDFAVLYRFLILQLILINPTQTFFEIRPWVNPNITITVPDHNFWPWIPIVPRPDPPFRGVPVQKSGDGDFFQIPSHNFWPIIPIVYPESTKNNLSTSYYEVPTHGFWPYFPSIGMVKPTTPPPPTTVTTLLPWPPSVNKYNYGEVLYKSILFFEAQRSGWLPSNRHVKWRDHSAINDRGLRGEDLTGGWYDSGDYVKFGLPMAAASGMLLWGLVQFPDAYRSAGLTNDILDCVKWPLDYFIKAHTKKFEFYAQVGDPYLDHTYWGRPEDMEMDRPAYRLTPNRPGSDVVADTAAAMAMGSIVFKTVDLDYSLKLLEHAQDLFQFAETYRGLYSDTIENAEEFYKSSSDIDELAWAAIWLYKATNNGHFLRRAKHWANQAPACWAQSWSDKSCGLPVLLYELTKEPRYKRQIEAIFSEWLPGGSVPYTPKGLAFRLNWGVLRYTANMAFVALAAAELGVQSEIYRRWARDQIHYMLGDAGRSYVIGFGHNPPTRPHHASSSCPSPPETCSWWDYTKPGPNSHVLYGALVGGPDENDEYEDLRGDFIHSEVGCDYNGGFQSAVAALRYLELQMT